MGSLGCVEFSNREAAQELMGESHKERVEWQEIQTWQRLMDLAIAQKVRQTQEVNAKLKEKFRGTKQDTNAGGLWGKAKSVLAVGVAKIMPRGKEPQTASDTVEERRLIEVSVMSILNQFTWFLSSRHLPRAKVLQLIRSYGQIFKLPSSKMSDLIIDLTRCHPIQQTHESRHVLLTAKTKHQQDRYGNGKAFVLAQATRYLGDRNSLRSLLLLNKDLSERLKHEVFKHVLMRLHLPMSLGARMEIWKQLLSTKRILLDYNTVKEKVLKEAVIAKTTDDIIQMDVQRSFTSIKSLNRAALTSILRTYAFYNPEIEYCQGMNFIVGFLFLLLRDESTTFKCLTSLVSRFKMDDLFAQNVPLLRSFFYQMDRLLYQRMPELANSFMQEGISANFYASAWFMTLFTNSMQFTEVDTPSDMLLAIWDAFLLYGWKAIFKTAFFILESLHDKLITARLDQAMLVFGDVTRGKFIQESALAPVFRARFPNIKITNTTLVQFAHEYHCLCLACSILLFTFVHCFHCFQ